MVATANMRLPNRQIYPFIDILRAFAATSVLIYHVIEHYSWAAWPTSGLLVWFRAGWLGVDLFFVISGFVIGLSAFAGIDRTDRLRADGQETPGFRWGFAVRRLFRIVPLHYLTCLIFAIMVVPALLVERVVPNALTHIFFIHNWWPTLHGAINGSNWSVATEMQFYLLIMLLAPLIKKSNWLILFLICFGVAWSWRYAMVQIVPTDGAMGTFPLFVFTTQLPGMMDEFGAGLLLAKFTSLPMGQRFIHMRGSFFIVSAMALAAIWVTADIYWQVADYWNNERIVIFFRSLVALCAMLVVLATCCIPSRDWLLKPLKPFLYLGTISYGIYLWHLLVLISLKELSWLSPERALVMTLVLTIILSIFSWHLFEKPILERSKDYMTPPRLFRRRRLQRPARPQQSRNIPVRPVVSSSPSADPPPVNPEP